MPPLRIHPAGEKVFHVCIEFRRRHLGRERTGFLWPGGRRMLRLRQWPAPFALRMAGHSLESPRRTLLWGDLPKTHISGSRGRIPVMSSFHARAV